MLARMSANNKTSQLQVRVSARDKAAIQRAAKRAGMDMSAYVLAKLLPAPQRRFDDLVAELCKARQPAFALAELNELLSACTALEFKAAVAHPLPSSLSPQLSNYVAAMVEYGAARNGVAPPPWVRDIPPLDTPMFGTEMLSLRLYLLSHSPPPFRRRNIFIDASLGTRV
jgi:uncharacterized protein (DUF1778 family)